MSQYWYHEDVAVDHAALDELRRTATSAAATLEDTAAHRLRLGVDGLASCAGPYADDLSDDIVRRHLAELDLAQQCRSLAALAVAAREQAAADQADRLRRRDEQRLEEARLASAAMAANAAMAAGTSIVAGTSVTTAATTTSQVTG